MNEDAVVEIRVGVEADSVTGLPFDPARPGDSAYTDMMEGATTAVLAAYAAGVRDRDRLQAILDTTFNQIADAV